MGVEKLNYDLKSPEEMGREFIKLTKLIRKLKQNGEYYENKTGEEIVDMPDEIHLLKYARRLVNDNEYWRSNFDGPNLAAGDPSRKEIEKKIIEFQKIDYSQIRSEIKDLIDAYDF